MKTINAYTYAEASPELKEKILEYWRNNHSGQDTFYAQDEGILYQKGMVGYEIFNNVIPKYWNVGYGHEWVQFELTIKDIEKFKKAFKISNRLWNKIEVDFVNTGEHNTKIRFRDTNYNEIDFDEEYDFDFSEVKREDRKYFVTRKEFEKLKSVSETFDNLIDNALGNLRKAFEYEFTEEYIKDICEANEYHFTEDGRLA